MKIKTISSILEVVQSQNIDVTEDLKKDEKTLASIKEILENDKKKEDSTK